MPTILVNIDVGDLEQAVRFYTQAFGLSVSRRFAASVVELAGAATPIYLIHAPEGSAPFGGAQQGRSYARHWSPIHLDFVVPELGAALQQALAVGATLERDPRHEVWGKIAVLADPWGNGFCLLEFVGRGYDELQ